MEKVAGHSDGSIHMGRWRESISWMDNDCECALESFFTTPSVCFYWMSSSFMAALTPTMRRWPAGGRRCGWRSAPVGSALPCTCGPLWLRWSWSTEILIKTPSVGAQLCLFQQCCPFHFPLEVPSLVEASWMMGVLLPHQDWCGGQSWSDMLKGLLP